MFFTSFPNVGLFVDIHFSTFITITDEIYITFSMTVSDDTDSTFITM